MTILRSYGNFIGSAIFHFAIKKTENVIKSQNEFVRTWTRICKITPICPPWFSLEMFIIMINWIWGNINWCRYENMSFYQQINEWIKLKRLEKCDKIKKLYTNTKEHSCPNLVICFHLSGKKTRLAIKSDNFCSLQLHLAC